MAWSNEELYRKIERVLKQCNSDGDEAMTFMAIYSFLEGYMRSDAREQLDKNIENRFWRDKTPNNPNDLSFGQVIGTFKYKKYLTGYNKDNPESRFLDEISSFHGRQSTLSSNTNKIRHEFDELDPSELSVVIWQFIKFAEYNNFSTDEIKKLLESHFLKNWTGFESSKIPTSITFNDILNNFNIDSNKDEEIRNLKKQINDYKLKLDPSNAQESTALCYKIFEAEQKIDDIETNKYSAYEDFILNISKALIKSKSFKDFETEILNLSEEQQSIYDFAVKNITDDCGQNLLVKGGPGTGKTLLLIKLLNYYIDQKKSPVLLTYYDSLSKYIKFQFSLINKAQGNVVHRNQLKTFLKSFYDFMESKIKDALGIETIFKMEEEDSNSVEKAKSKFIGLYPQEGNELFNEAYNKIWPDLLSCQAYKERYEKSQESKYQDYWNKIQDVQNKLNEELECVDRYAYYRFCIEEDAPVPEKRDYILIDETQDLTNAQLAAVKKLCKHSCIYVGDMNQSIRNKNVSWKSIGVNINANYSKKLSANYRSTVQIQTLGKKYLECCKIHDDEDLNAEAHSNGLDPALIYATESDLRTKIIDSVKLCIDTFNIALGNICIVTFSDEELVDIKKLLAQESIESDRISEGFEFGEEKIRLSTVKYIKGIDCPVLLFVADSRYVSEEKSGISQENLANSIYTCITRAMYFLQIFVTEESKSNIAIKELVELMENKDIETSEVENTPVYNGTDSSNSIVSEMPGSQPKKIIIKYKSGYTPENNEPRKKIVVKKKQASALDVLTPSSKQKKIVIKRNSSDSSPNP